MSEQLEVLRRRIASLERRVTLLVICCGVLAAYLLLFAARGVVKADAQPGTLTLKRLAIVDTKGTERVVIEAPLPDPIIEGRRVHRDGPVSGVLIFDPKGNERGGYVTSDSGDMAASYLLTPSAIRYLRLMPTLTVAQPSGQQTRNTMPLP